MFTCGLVRSNFSLAIFLSPGRCCVASPRPPLRYAGNESRFAPSLLPAFTRQVGAHDQNRTDDLVLTKDALCRLSYVGVSFFLLGGCSVAPPSPPLAQRE